MAYLQEGKACDCSIVFSGLNIPVNCYGRYKNKFYSFLGSEVYIHNSEDANRSTFYGVKYDTILDVVGNERPNLTKTFEALGIDTDGDWVVTDVTVEANQNYPNGMLSEIPSGMFEEREGYQMADFLRNKYTSSSTASSVDLYEGEVLRGKSIYIKMKNTSTSEVKVFSVLINASDSKV